MSTADFEVIPCYLGTGIDMLILGIIGSQFVYWAARREKDECYIRGYMAWTFACSIVHSGYVQAFGWTVFISHGGLGGWWIKGLCLFEIVLAGPVEMVYAWRAYNLWGRPKWLAILMALLFANFYVVGITILALPPTGAMEMFRSPIFTAWIAAYIMLEVILAVLLVVALWRKRTGINTSDRLLLRIILLSAEAQLFPCLIAIGIIIWVKLNPTSAWIFLFFCAPKLWVVTCNIVINSRKRLRRSVEIERERRQNTLNTHPELLSPSTAVPEKERNLHGLATSLPELHVRYPERAERTERTERGERARRSPRDGQMSFEEMLHSA